MSIRRDAPPAPLSYFTPARLPRIVRHARWLPALPILYLAAYVTLRLLGVYHLFYNQGGWEMDGTTRVSAIDSAFAPAAFAETDSENKLSLLREPSGG